MFQEITLIGRIGLIKDLKDYGDQVVQNFTMITEERYRKADPETGELKKFKKEIWWTCSCWNGMAQAFHEWKKKGDLIQVKGRIDINEVPQEDGSTRTYINVRCTNLTFLPTPRKQEQPDGAQQKEVAIEE